MLWEKQKGDGKYYLNRWRVTDSLYNAVKIGDYFKLNKHNYLNEFKHEAKQNIQTPNR